MFVYCPPLSRQKRCTRSCCPSKRKCCSVGLAYRVIDTAAGDLGTSRSTQVRLRGGVPTQGTYRELTSTSNCTTYQARCLNVRERTRTP